MSISGADSASLAAKRLEMESAKLAARRKKPNPDDLSPQAVAETDGQIVTRPKLHEDGRGRYEGDTASFGEDETIVSDETAEDTAVTGPDSEHHLLDIKV